MSIFCPIDGTDSSKYLDFYLFYLYTAKKYSKRRTIGKEEKEK
jgi:hypothetical protein